MVDKKIIEASHIMWDSFLLEVLNKYSRLYQGSSCI
ncbi:MAG: hypothetical protein PWP67_2695 [Clostridium butyricum]|jgi:hypothetical protein|nr:hypothetical protein [Clostridium butyricum]